MPQKPAPSGHHFFAVAATARKTFPEITGDRASFEAFMKTTHGWTIGIEYRGQVVDLDHLLTIVSLYWFSGAAGDAIRIYKEGVADPLALGPGERIAPPLSVALFPRELPMPPVPGPRGSSVFSGGPARRGHGGRSRHRPR